MRPLHFFLLCVLLAATPCADAQQVWLTTPMVNVSDSFYENIGVNWGYNFGGGNGPRNGSQSGAFFNMGNNSTPPAFGGYDPAADATFGFRAGPFSFRLRAGQGSTRSIVGQAPSIMLPNGGSGFFASGTARPFVTGIEPIVNGVMTGRIRPRRGVSVLRERWNRYMWLKKHKPWVLEDPKEPEKKKPVEKLDPRIGTEDEPLVLVAEPVQEKSAQANGGKKQVQVTRHPAVQRTSASSHGADLRRLLNRARSLEQRGKFFYSRLYYEQAEKKATTPQLKQLLRARIQALMKRNEG